MARRTTARSPAVQATTIASPGHVGRVRELASLAVALTQPPAVVLLEGEAGIGKSRLVQEFLATADSEYHSLVAICPPFREPYTLGPVVDAVRQATDSVRGLRLSGVAGALRPLFPEWAAELPPAPEPLEDATAARHRLFRALAELLGCLDVAVLVVEDVHWADEATLEFLLFLVSRRPLPVSLVVTYRPEDVPAGSLLLRLSSRMPAGVTQRRLAIGPLDIGETAALVSSMLAGEHVSAEFAAFLHQRTEGLPLALEESVRLMYDRADLTRQNGAWVRRRLDHIDVPPTVRDAVLERVERLGPDTQAVMRAIAVLTEPADYATLTAVTEFPADRATTRVADAFGSGLLREDPRGLVSFRHALACRAVYEAIPAQERRALHLRAGRALEGLAAPPLAQLARHFREAGKMESWCRYAEEAAELARRSGDEAAAGHLLHSLVTTIALPVERLVRLVRRIPFHSLPEPGRYSGVVETLRSALARTGLTAAEDAALHFQLGRVLMMAGAYEDSRLEMRRAVPHLPPDSVEAGRARIFLGIPIGNVQPASEHLRWLRQAATVMPSVSPLGRLHLLVDRSLALLLLGEEEGWVEAQRIPDEARTREEEALVALSHINLGHAAIMWGRYARADQHLTKALDLVTRQEYFSWRHSVMASQAHLDWFTGAWDGLAQRAAALADQDELPLKDRCEPALVAGLIAAAAGDQRQAEERLLFARGDGQQHIESAAALARLWLSDGRMDDALHITDEPVDIAVHKGIWPLATEIAPVRAQALAAAGRTGEAAELVTTFAGAVGSRDAPAAQASLMTCRAILTEAEGHHAPAAALFAQAAAAWQALPRPYDALLTHERQGRCLLAAGRDDAGLPLLSDVFHGLSRLGARHDADRVQHTLRHHGLDARKPARGGRPSYGDRLSPRELDVARLLLGGRTNRQIATELVLSPQTVASHLNSAMRKLRVDSRTGLALKVVQLGLVSDDVRPPAGNE